ncbi:hypothetical protein F2Q70_00027228 [Brassica cretica]|uniref:Uncharacterized protein n=1 Tax=Brassica cretica TaxID=69181 RepID=A0A8S9L7L6_BRACR|nr:hypothetical protein F2Q68_00026776 [Brassica cretica]KAF2601613.1 hypothetical protein F2Q70_00027228 [Brassica cretica]
MKKWRSDKPGETREKLGRKPSSTPHGKVRRGTKSRRNIEEADMLRNQKPADHHEEDATPEGRPNNKRRVIGITGLGVFSSLFLCEKLKRENRGKGERNICFSSVNYIF